MAAQVPNGIAPLARSGRSSSSSVRGPAYGWTLCCLWLGTNGSIDCPLAPWTMSWARLGCVNRRRCSAVPVFQGRLATGPCRPPAPPCPHSGGRRHCSGAPQRSHGSRVLAAACAPRLGRGAVVRLTRCVGHSVGSACLRTWVVLSDASCVGRESLPVCGEFAGIDALLVGKTLTVANFVTHIWWR